MKKIVMVAVAVMVCMMVLAMPVMASVAHVEADEQLEELQIRLANGYGLSVTDNKWVYANGANWRKVYASQNGKRIAILLQWEDYEGNSWFTVSTAQEQMDVAGAIAYLQTRMRAVITRMGVNAERFGYRIEGAKKGDRVVVRQVAVDGRMLSEAEAVAQNGWHWLIRRKGAVRAVITLFHRNGGVTNKEIVF